MGSCARTKRLRAGRTTIQVSSENRSLSPRLGDKLLVQRCTVFNVAFLPMNFYIFIYVL